MATEIPKDFKESRSGFAYVIYVLLSKSILLLLNSPKFILCVYVPIVPMWLKISASIYTFRSYSHTRNSDNNWSVSTGLVM